MKFTETNPKEVKELKEEFNHITSSEVEKVIPTYQKYPEKTKELLAIQNEIRDLKVKINEASASDPTLFIFTFLSFNLSFVF